MLHGHRSAYGALSMEGYNQVDHLFIYWIGHRKYVHIQMFLCPFTIKGENKNKINAEAKIEQTVKLKHF